MYKTCPISQLALLKVKAPFMVPFYGAYYLRDANHRRCPSRLAPRSRSNAWPRKSRSSQKAGRLGKAHLPCEFAARIEGLEKKGFVGKLKEPPKQL